MEDDREKKTFKLLTAAAVKNIINNTFAKYRCNGKAECIEEKKIKIQFVRVLIIIKI